MYDQHSHRKDEHVFLAEKFYQAQPDNGLAEVRLIPNNLPEISVAKVSLASTLAGKKIAAPFFINAMSGGSPETAKLNQKLASAAAATDIPMATGSQSIALKFPQAAASFKIVRQNLPNGLVIGNIGASHNLSDAKAAVEMLQADLLEVHLNAAQEIVMAEGDRQFYWEENLQQIITGLSVPVIVKEVGFGISPATLARLQKLGVKNVDLSGHGGTNFAKIENQRRRAKDFSLLNNFGLTTAETLLASQHFASSFSFTASGGIRDALDIVKCLVLGADNVGIAGLFLHTLIKEDVTGLINLIEDLKKQLKSILALLGCANPAELKQVPYLLSTELNNFKQQIK